MDAIIALASLAFQLVILAVVLSVVGVYTNRFLTRVFEIKRQSSMMEDANIAAAKSRAAKRASARA